MPEFVMLVGLPGSGKTTLRKDIVRRMTNRNRKPLVMSSDDMIEAKAAELGLTYDDVYSDGELVSQVYKDFHLWLDASLKAGRNIILDRTNVDEGSRMSVLSRVPCTYTIHFEVIQPPRDAVEMAELVKRLKNRPGKTIPVDVMVNFANRFTIPEFGKEPLDSLTIYDIFGIEVSKEKYRKIAA